MLTKREGSLTRAIEKRTAEIPSGTFLAVAGGSLLASLVSMIAGRKNLANFIGQWAPTLLLLGMYNKFVKEAT